MLSIWLLWALLLFPWVVCAAADALFCEANRGLAQASLVAAITQTWLAQDYDGAIRDAVNELERRMKALAGGERISGAGSSIACLTPKRNPAPVLSDEIFMGPLGAGECSGAHELVRGSVGLFRNAITAKSRRHRSRDLPAVRRPSARRTALSSPDVARANPLCNVKIAVVR